MMLTIKGAGSGWGQRRCVNWVCQMGLRGTKVFKAYLVKGTQIGRVAAQFTLKTLRMGCPTPADGAPQPADGASLPAC